jgi:antitoxin ChpS
MSRKDKPKSAQRKRSVARKAGRKRYTLNELLQQCDPNAPRSKEEREWLSAKPVGRELI